MNRVDRAGMLVSWQISLSATPSTALEFRADPESPYHNPALSKEKTAVLYCASGGRSALAGKTLQELGYKSVYNAGAFKDLAEAGLETEPA
jgi:rhodanese-related sulfurtransferase